MTLDFSLWAMLATYAQKYPAYYITVNLGALVAIGLLVLYEADLLQVYHDLRVQMSQRYQPLSDAPPTPAVGGEGKPVRMMREATLRRELHKEVDATEELELQLLVRRGSTDGGKALEEGETLQQLEAHQARRDKLQGALRQQALASSSEKRLIAPKGCWDRCSSSTLAKVFGRSLNGLITVWLYFADIISDIEVMLLLYAASEFSFAYIAGALLLLQFLVVYWRVLPYLHSTFGPDAAIYRGFAWLGFPVGMLFLDCFMFLEPFGLLPIVPLPDRMRQFIPAYKATRIIAEVMIESLPQCLLQSYILYTVMQHVSAHTESEAERFLLNSAIDGDTFARILPRSIAISTVTMLKTWIELVHSAREAGISVRTKFVQLWHVGHGLPLDALKKGTIVEWSCTYELADGEVPPLLDALAKNSSLERLNLAEAALDFSGPDARKERSAAPLIDAMAASSAALAALQNLVVSAVSGYEIPVERLRKGNQKALSVLAEKPFLRKGGPRRLEMLVMSDLLRKNRRTLAVSAADVEFSANAVVELIEAAARGEVSIGEWQERVAKLIVAGDTRRAHFRSLISAEVLRNVGFTAEALIAVEFSDVELKEGGFLARELREVGYSHAKLQQLGYTTSELKQAGLTASDLRGLGVPANELQAASFSAVEARVARYSLQQLADGGYAVAELKEADFTAGELRQAGFGAADLRKSKAFTAGEMREGGYTAMEMRDGGIDLRRMYAAGYGAAEVASAGWPLNELKDIGYEPRNLRRAGFTASEMRAVGFELDKLRSAEYTPAELQEAGFDAAALKEAGTSLFQLKQANTPIETLKEAGYRADRLKLQGYTAAELAQGGFTAKELRGFRDALYEDAEYAGYTAKELREGRVAFSAAELRAGGYTESELREGGYRAAELRAKGYTVSDLSGGGYGAKELYEGGFALEEIKALGHDARELKALGVTATDLRRVAYSAQQLRKAGFAAMQLMAAGFSANELARGGFTPRQLMAVGLGPRDLRGVGFGAAELRDAGFTPKELKGHGFSVSELREGGYTDREVDAVSGRSVNALRVEGYSAAEMRAIGYAVGELRSGGYSCKELKLIAQFSDDELMSGGFKSRSVDAVDGRTPSALRDAGFGARELRGIGFVADELVDAGYPMKELRELGYTCKELKEVGVAAGTLREGGYTTKELKAAGFTLREMRDGGTPWKECVIFLKATHAELEGAGWKGLDPKDMLFKQYRPE